MVGYGIYLLAEWMRISGGGGGAPPSPAPPAELLMFGRPMLTVVALGEGGSFFDKLPEAWFIYLFIGVGAVIFIVSLFGCIGAGTRNTCCLCCYSFLVILLILAEAGGAAFIFFDHSWKDVIPVDKTQNFDAMYDFLKENWKIARWVALGVVIFQVLLFLLALVVRAMNKPAEMLRLLVFPSQHLINVRAEMMRGAKGCERSMVWTPANLLTTHQMQPDISKMGHLQLKKGAAAP
ncbi:hypothetical protein ZWY2020_005952 [Hordeum vulgare]|nr:hypothetical protein ZWY2020_005952 [Hordeum vulgare]